MAAAALVLAAGEGRRLRPLSTLRPKPLCPVAGVALVDLALERAAAAVGTGPAALAVNAHHGAGALAEHLGSRVHLSREEPEALGTAGAVGVLRPWLDGRDLLVLNGDTWCPAPVTPLLEGWDGERLRVLLAGGGAMTGRPRVAGALLPWAEAARLHPEPSGLWEVSWRAALAEGRLEVVAAPLPFVDCGTPAAYLAANLAALGPGRSLLGDGAAVSGTATRSVVGAGARVEGAVERCVLWPGAVVRRGVRLVDAVVTPELTVLVRP